MANPTSPAIHYPDSDGRRMAENTLQAEWILTVFGNLDALFRDRPDVFVAMDNLWYPIKGKPKRRAAPDVYVAFGRPKGRRGSYKQWEEGGVPLTVAFEVWSPGNRHKEMLRKFRFYERYGVEEYYIIDPDGHTFDAYHRRGKRLVPQRVNGGLVSPRLGVRFAKTWDTDVQLVLPDGRPFLSFVEIEVARSRAEQEARTAQQEARAAEQEARTAQQEADDARRETHAAQARAAALAAKLRELGLDPDAV
jgi:hypothetical protein